ncbi:MAG: hypothetical protein ACI9OJ_000668 [Myxococcota bacterium]|jgi:hypothetical protein
MLKRHCLTILIAAFAVTSMFCGTAMAEPLDATEAKLKTSGVDIVRMKMAIYPSVKKKAKAIDFAGWAVRADMVQVLVLSFASEADAKAAPPLLKKWHTELVYHSQVIVNGKDLMIIGAATPREPKASAKRSIAALIKAFK